MATTDPSAGTASQPQAPSPQTAPVVVSTSAVTAPPATPSAASTAAKTGALTVGGVTLGAIIAGWAIGKGADFFLTRAWHGLKHIVRSSYEDTQEVFERARSPVALTARRHFSERPRRPTEVQSLLFPRTVFTPKSARRWAASHGYRTAKVHSTANYVRMRQAPPEQFTGMRTISLGHGGIKAVVGHRKR